MLDYSTILFKFENKLLHIYIRGNYQNTMDRKQCMDNVVQFELNNRELLDKAYEITGDVKILSKMYSNQKLTSMILALNPFVYVDVIRAVDRLKIMKLDGIIVNFTDLNIYAVFHYDQYRRLLNKITEVIEDEELDNSDIHLYQVVLVGQRQKLVIACTDPAYFNKLQRYISEYFKAEVTRDGNQFTVNLYMESEKEFEDKYENFHTFINNKNDKKCYESMKRIDVVKERNDQYREYDISAIPPGSAKNLQDVIKLVKTISDDEYKKFKLVINVNNNINNIAGNVNGNINNCNNRLVNNQVQTKEQRIQTARYWISNNNPVEGELASLYYERYKTANNNPIAHRDFGPMAREILKRDYIRNAEGRHW